MNRPESAALAGVVGPDLHLMVVHVDVSVVEGTVVLPTHLADLHEGLLPRGVRVRSWEAFQNSLFQSSTTSAADVCGEPPLYPATRRLPQCRPIDECLSSSSPRWTRVLRLSEDAVVLVFAPVSISGSASSGSSAEVSVDATAQRCRAQFMSASCRLLRSPVGRMTLTRENKRGPTPLPAALQIDAGRIGFSIDRSEPVIDRN
jgi:hypothetical protein